MIDNNGVILNPPFVRSPYNYDRDLASTESGLLCLDPTRTQKQFKDECDINVIIERFGVTGQLPVMAVQPMSGDFTGIGDYREALDVVAAANENFYRLSSKVREKFNNDARQFVDFCVNPGNIEAVRELGLAPRPGVPGLVEVVKQNGKSEGNSSDKSSDK